MQYDYRGSLERAALRYWYARHERSDEDRLEVKGFTLATAALARARMTLRTFDD